MRPLYKRLRLLIAHSLGYPEPKLTVRLPEIGGSIRDAIKEAGFQLGDDVVLVKEDDWRELLAAKAREIARGVECCRWHIAGGDASFSCCAMTPSEFEAQGRPRVNP
jgi:hypothetical protein